MADITHVPFRMLVHHYGGCDYYFTEMVSAASYNSHGVYEDLYTSSLPDPEKTVVQLVSNSEDHLVAASDRLDRESDFLGIDINMGCAAPKLMRYGNGLAWMRNRERTRALIFYLRRVVKSKLLSIKIRMGIDDDPEFLYRFVEMAKDEGVDFITFHGRIRRERYARLPRWEHIPEISRITGLPIIGNGDVNSYGTFVEKKKRYAPYGVMIGRKAASSPWFFSYLKKRMTGEEEMDIDLLECYEKLFELIEEHLPEELHHHRLRALYPFINSNIGFGHGLTLKMNRVRSYDEQKEIARNYFSEYPESRIRVEKL